MSEVINLHEHMYRGHPMEGFLYWGNTSVASAGDEGHWSVAQQEAIYSGRRPGPRLFPSGGFVVPAHVKALPERLRVRTSEQLRRYMDHLSGLGAAQIKASPFGRRDPWVETECIEAAHRRGLPVLSHFFAQRRWPKAWTAVFSRQWRMMRSRRASRAR